VRSTQTVNEQNQANDRNDSVTVANNLPPGDNTDTAGSGTGSKSSRNEETINYEISRTVRNHVRETGQVRRLSVAVLVDGVYEPAAGGPPVYKPRPPEELKQIESLVRSAIGFDGARGDAVEIVNMRFTAPDTDLAGSAADGLFGLGKEDLFRIAEMLIMAIVAVLVILLVIRPLMARMFERASAAEEEEAARMLTNQSSAQAQLTGPGQSSLAENLALEDAQAEEEMEQMIDISRVEGRVRASSLRKVGEIVEKHPEEAVSIIRNWLYQET
jgi:flagellar M-ring protein FliF